MAGCLVCEQVDFLVCFHCVFQQIYDISMEGNGDRFLFFLIFFCKCKGFFGGTCHGFYPPQAHTQFYFRDVYLCDDAHALAKLNGFTLRPAHAPKAC